MPFAPGSFWSQLDDADQAALRSAGTRRDFPAGTALLREGAPARAVIVLLAGQVKVTSLAAGGHEAVFAVLGAGDIIGELSTMDNRPCTATVRAIDQVAGLTLTPQRFLAVLDRRPRLARALLHVITDRLRQSNRRQVEYGETTVATRLAALLVDLSVQHGTPTPDGAVRITLPVTQRELAGLVAASREAVARGLHELREQGIVRTGRQQITVLRPDLLRKAASP